MHKSKIDLGILILFFNRPEKLAKVFESVREARPARLYLYQDGPRKNRYDDITNIASCREIVANIDWECELHTNYQSKNFGCDPSEFIAQKWFFSHEEMGIVIEDDDVPAQSFFPYCKELLERYKDDSQIAMICGMNNYDISCEVSESYFFSKRGSIWGWASWRRFLDKWDENYSWLDNPQQCRKIQEYCEKSESCDYQTFIKIAKAHKKTGRAHYESIMFAAAALNDTLNIVPKYNMITNIGFGGESTHGAQELHFACKRVQNILNKKIFEIELPLVHPKEIKCNNFFDKKFKLNFCQKGYDFIEKEFRNLFFGGFRFYMARIKKRLSK